MDTTTFANKIREKYPDGVSSDGRSYRDIPDQELTTKIVTKYPVYQSQITDYKPFGAKPTLGETIASRTKAAVESPGEAAKGFAKSAIKTAVDVGTKFPEAIGKGTLSLLGADTSKAGLDYTAVDELTTPENEAQKAGGNLETAAELVSGGGLKPVQAGAKALLKANAERVAEETAAKLAKKAVKTEQATLDAIRTSPENMTKNQLREAVNEGRQVESTTMTGGTKVDYKPTAEEIRAAEILKDEGVARAKKGDVVSKIKNAISTRGAEAEKYLGDNVVALPKTLQNAYLDQMVNNAKNVLTKTELGHYIEQVDLFKKQLADMPGNTQGLYKGLKKWEQDIAEHLPKGKEALMDPTGVASAKIHAAADIRTAVRDLIGELHPEFKDKMYDLMSLYKVKPTAIENAVKNITKTFSEKHPKVVKAAKYGAAATALYGLGSAGKSAIDVLAP